MKKIVLTGAMLLLAALGLGAQDFRLEWPADSIPASATKILEQRIGQMLDAGGLKLSDDASAKPLSINYDITSRMETPGSMSQVALTIDLIINSGEVSETFPLKGVGDNEADAWTRAVKMFLPRSKAAQTFLLKLK